MNKSIRKVKLISRNIFSSCNILFQFQSTILTKRESTATSIVLMMHGLLERRKYMKILSDGVLSGLQLFQEKQRESLQFLFVKWFKMQLLPTLKRLHITTYNAKLEATNNLIKLIKRNAFGFRNFENFKKRIFIALNIKKERTHFVLSRAQLFFNPLQLKKSLDY